MAPHTGEPERNTFGFRFGMPQSRPWEIEPLEEAMPTRIFNLNTSKLHATIPPWLNKKYIHFYKHLGEFKKISDQIY